MLNEPIVISNFQRAMSSSPHLADGAFSQAHGMDVTRQLGSIRLSNILEKKSGTTITGKPKWIVRNPDNGDLYLTDTDHKLYKSTDNGSTWALVTHSSPSTGTGNGLGFWKDHIFLVGNTKIDSYGPISSSPAWNDAWQSLTNSATIYGPVFIGQDDIVYIGNKNLLVSIAEVSGQDFDDGNGSTFTFNASALDLPEEFRIRDIEELGRNLLIGTFRGGSDADDTTNSSNEAHVFPWDRTSAFFELPTVVPEQGIRSMKKINGIVYIVAGAFGNVYTYNETFLKPFAQLPSSVLDRNGGETIDVVPQGIGFFNGFPHIFYGGGTGSAVNGVYVLVGNRFNFQFIISSNNTDTNIKAGPIDTPQGNVFLVGWQDTTVTASQGVDSLNSSVTDTTGKTVFFETELIQIGTKLKPQTLSNIDIQFTELETLVNITVAHRSNLDDSFVTIETLTTRIDNKDSVSIPTSISTDKIQIRLTFTQTVSGSNNLPISSVTLS